jgi:hypothetical protein
MVNAVVPVLVTLKLPGQFGPPTVPIYVKVVGETVKPVDASARSTIVWTTTRQTIHTKIELNLKSTACTLGFRVDVPTVITPSG